MYSFKPTADFVQLDILWIIMALAFCEFCSLIALKVFLWFRIIDPSGLVHSIWGLYIQYIDKVLQSWSYWQLKRPLKHLLHSSARKEPLRFVSVDCGLRNDLMFAFKLTKTSASPTDLFVWSAQKYLSFYLACLTIGQVII